MAQQEKKQAPEINQEAELLILEVEEDLRHEFGLRFLKKYGRYLVVLALFIVVGVAARALWQNWVIKQNNEASQKYNLAEELYAVNKPDQAYAVLTQLENGSQEGYRILAAMQHASLLIDKGNLDQAVQIYEKLSHSSVPKLYRDLATLKEVTLIFDHSEDSVIREKLVPLTVSTNPWRYSALELLAVLDNLHNHKDDATNGYKKIADDILAPVAMRSRASEMLSSLLPSSSPIPSSRPESTQG